MNLWGGIPDGYCVAVVGGPGPGELLGRLRAGLIAETTLSFSALLDEAPRDGNSSLIGVAEIPRSFWDAGPEWVCTFEPGSAVVSAKAASLAVRGAEVYAVAYRPGELHQFAWALEIETAVKYAGYIERQKTQVAQTEKLDNVRLPSDFSYVELTHLSREAREKLDRVRPQTLGQASRIGGVSPADISVLLVWLESRRRAKRQDKTEKSEREKVLVD